MRKKEEYEQNVALSEAFLEAVPTTVIFYLSYNKSIITFIILNSDPDFKLLSQ